MYVREADLEEVSSQEATFSPHAKVTRQDVPTNQQLLFHFISFITKSVQ